jgi:hypothetical protein
VKLDAIADQWGHVSIATTHIYARIVDQLAENPERYLGAVLTGSIMKEKTPVYGGLILLFRNIFHNLLARIQQNSAHL